MYISQLNAIHRSQRAELKYRLEEAGWDGRKSNTLFEQGRWVPDEAVYDFYGDKAFLSVLYNAEEKTIELVIEDLVGRLNFVFCPGDFFSQLLEEIIDVQYELSCLQYIGFIRRMILMLPDVFVYQREQRLRLVLNS